MQIPQEEKTKNKKKYKFEPVNQPYIKIPYYTLNYQHKTWRSRLDFQSANSNHPSDLIMQG